MGSQHARSAHSGATCITSARHCAIGWLLLDRGQFTTLLRAKRDGFAALPWLLRERRGMQAMTTVQWREIQAVMQSAAAGYMTASGRARRARERARALLKSADLEP